LNGIYNIQEAYFTGHCKCSIKGESMTLSMYSKKLHSGVQIIRKLLFDPN